MILDKTPEWLVGDEIKWNFTKFLIDPSDRVIQRYEPYGAPIDFGKDINQLLNVKIS